MPYLGYPGRPGGAEDILFVTVDATKLRTRDITGKDDSAFLSSDELATKPLVVIMI
jgi:hypothetical protein